MSINNTLLAPKPGTLLGMCQLNKNFLVDSIQNKDCLLFKVSKQETKL